MARTAGRGQGLPGPVVPSAGSASRPNHRGAKSYPNRRGFSHEQGQALETEKVRAIAGKQRRLCEESSRLRTDPRSGGHPEASVSLTTARTRLICPSPRNVTPRPLTPGRYTPAHATRTGNHQSLDRLRSLLGEAPRYHSPDVCAR